MATESGVQAPSTSASAGESYIGSFISLISKYEIRYEGVLYFLDINDSTIGLKKVRSYGTEGRKRDGPQVPPSDNVYEYILFRASDIKDLQVKSSPAANAEEHIYNDPAIIQSQHSGMPLNSSPTAAIGGKVLTEPIQRQDTPAMIGKVRPSGFPSYQSVSQSGPSATTQVTAYPYFSMPTHWQGYNGTSTNSSLSLQPHIPFQVSSSVSSPWIMQNQMQASETRAPTNVNMENSLECGTPVSSSVASTLVNTNKSPSLSPLQFSDPLDIASFLSSKASVPYSASMTVDRLNLSSLSSSFQDINSSKAQIVGNINPDPRPILPGPSVHYSASSIVDNASGPLLTPPPYLLTPDQIARPRLNSSSPIENLFLNQKDMGSLTSTSSYSLLASNQASQAPLLPLPISVQQSQYSTTQFTEEFDFIAMNEKFKKDEVWGSLGKKMQKVKGAEDNATGQNFGEGEGQGPVLNPKPAYNKDEFFDTISCNSLARGGGQNRLFHRMRQDSETFGNFQQRPPIRYGAYGTGLGENYRGSYNWGRGYGYGGRGHIGHPPF
ncbi:Decapping 5-like protein [Quillaja saponaria]|uniref:Decapping 5-like protein n=1 Tax=Quillaja saponaria TaxID=32244 RepID=A0AAD7PFS9_QUISA|nr:Decapping 5-like protein [Quillaja saponaria]